MIYIPNKLNLINIFIIFINPILKIYFKKIKEIMKNFQVKYFKTLINI